MNKKVSPAKGGAGQAVLMMGFLLLAACTQAPDPSKKISQAPTSEKTTGVVVSQVSQESFYEFLVNNPQLHYRELSSKHEIFEVYGTEVETVKQQLPEATVAKNSFHRFFQKKATKGFSIAEETTEVTVDLINYFLGATSYDVIKEDSKVDYGTFSECRLNGEQPKISARISQKGRTQNLLDFLKAQSIKDIESLLGAEVGTAVSLSSAGSQATKPELEKLKMIWFMLPAEGSLIQRTMAEGANYTFTPDSPGEYNIFAAFQDAQGYCTVLELPLPLLVTTNKPFVKKEVQDPQVWAENSTELDQMWWLSDFGTTDSWEMSEGEGQVIAILDTGVNYNHPALSDNIYVNTNEIPGNGIDDDNNGYIDDVTGYDFNGGDEFPNDDAGHGSHVAGLSASSVFGQARKAKIMPIKVLNTFGGADIATIAASIFYAVDQGADVINMSLGFHFKPEPYTLWKSAFDYAEKHGVIIMVAAGNGDSMGRPVNIDETIYYPADFANENTIVVAASSGGSTPSSYTNYGTETVDIIAPGGDRSQLMFSAFTENAAEKDMVAYMGTSMATPVAAGLVAQIRSLQPDLSPVEIKNLLISAGKENDFLKQLISSGRQLNALDALHLAQTPLP